MKSKSVRGTGTEGISLQKSLSTFIEGKDIEKEIEDTIEGMNIEVNKIESKMEIHKEVDMKVEDKIIEKRRLSNQIETDYYDQSRIETCVKRVRERFNVDVDVIPVRYGRKPPINHKIYGYYMLITVKGKGYDHIVDFIRNDCNLKVYT